MHQNQDTESGETIPLILRPLTPEEMEANQAIYDKVWDEVLGYVFGDDDDNKIKKSST